MNPLDLAEIQILILENALESAKQHTARCKRRLAEAEVTFSEASIAEMTLSRSINSLRDTYLQRAA